MDNATVTLNHDDLRPVPINFIRKIVGSDLVNYDYCEESGRKFALTLLAHPEMDYPLLSIFNEYALMYRCYDDWFESFYSIGEILDVIGKGEIWELVLNEVADSFDIDLTFHKEVFSIGVIRKLSEIYLKRKSKMLMGG